MFFKHLEQLRTMRQDLTEPKEKAYELIFKSGLSRRDVSELSGISIPRVHSIFSGGRVELDRATQLTLNALANGYDKVIVELHKFK